MCNIMVFGLSTDIEYDNEHWCTSNHNAGYDGYDDLLSAACCEMLGDCGVCAQNVPSEFMVQSCIYSLQVINEIFYMAAHSLP